MKMHISVESDGCKIMLTADTDDEVVHGGAESIEDAAGWVMHHLSRHIEQADALFKKLGIKPTPRNQLVKHVGGES